MTEKCQGSPHAQWAEFRFGVIGGLFSAPPARGELARELLALAERKWTHPITGEPVMFHVSTIARWYYAARDQPDSMTNALRLQIRKDRGHHRPHFVGLVWEKLVVQYSEHPGWTYQLHADNVRALCNADPNLGPTPSYSTVRRHLQGQGMLRRPARRDDHRPQAFDARNRRSEQESRGWEMSHVHALWHLDFKDSPLPILTRSGERKFPQLLGVIDNRSRLACHLQWYLGEGAEELVHGFGQALQKRGKPRSIMMDNGAAMKAGETRQGLLDLSIQLSEIPSYTPEHNAIVEAFWKQVSKRLMPMLERVPDLSLAQLNEATQAFVELEYNRHVHSETKQTPIERLLAGPSVAREAPSTDELRQAFRLKGQRKQRASDGTISVEGIRFEIPNCYRHLQKLMVRYARWDLSNVDLWDDALGLVLVTLYPVNREANASGFRRPLGPVQTTPHSVKPGQIAPLLLSYIEQYRQTGLPPAYLPKDDCADSEEP